MKYSSGMFTTYRYPQESWIEYVVYLMRELHRSVAVRIEKPED